MAHATDADEARTHKFETGIPHPDPEITHGVQIELRLTERADDPNYDIGDDVAVVADSLTVNGQPISGEFQIHYPNPSRGASNGLYELSFDRQFTGIRTSRGRFKFDGVNRITLPEDFGKEIAEALGLPTVQERRNEQTMKQLRAKVRTMTEHDDDFEAFITDLADKIQDE